LIDLGTGRLSLEDNYVFGLVPGTSVIGGTKRDFIRFQPGSANGQKSRVSGGGGNDFVVLPGGNLSYNGGRGDDILFVGISADGGGTPQDASVDFIGGSGKDLALIGDIGGANKILFRDFKPDEGDAFGFDGTRNYGDIRISFGILQGVKSIVASFSDDSFYFDLKKTSLSDIASGFQNFLNRD
jgi:hypothetical protein